MNDDNSLDSNSSMSSFGNLSSNLSDQLDSLRTEIGQLKEKLKKAELNAPAAKMVAKEAKLAFKENNKLVEQLTEKINQLEQRAANMADQMAQQQGTIAGLAEKLEQFNPEAVITSLVQLDQRIVVLEETVDEQKITKKLTQLHKNVDSKMYALLVLLYTLAFISLNAVAVYHLDWFKAIAQENVNLASEFAVQVAQLRKQLGNVKETEIKFKELTVKQGELEQEVSNIVNKKIDPLQKNPVVVPLSLGIEVFGGVIRPFIKRNTTIPAFASAIFNNEFWMDKFLINVYEGERVMAKDNKLLGKFQLRNIGASEQVEVTFAIEANGILRVCAQNTVSRKLSGIAINTKRRLISKEEIERQVLEAEQHRTEDENLRHLVVALESYLYYIKQTMADEKNMISEDRKKMLDKWQETLSWLMDSNKQEIIIKKEEFERRFKELVAICNPIIVKLRQGRMPGFVTRLTNQLNSFVLSFLTRLLG